MSKIFLTCTFLAVCVNFLQVGAGMIQNPLDSLLGQARNQFEDGRDHLNSALQDIVEGGSESLRNLKNLDTPKLGTKLGERLSDGVQKVVEKGEELRNKASNVDTSSCDKLCDDVQVVATDLVSTFSSCLLNGTQITEMNVLEPMDLVNDLQKVLSEQLEKALQCIANPYNIIPCLTGALQNVWGAISAIGKMISFYPRMVLSCGQQTLQLVPSHLLSLLNDVGMCFQNVVSSLM